MSDKAEAAQKWAESKAALDAASDAYDAAKLAYSKAEDAEYHAWQALEALAGRTSAAPVAPEAPEVHASYGTSLRLQTQASGQMLQQGAMRHSLPVKPIG